MSDASAPLSAGDAVGPYRVVRALGGGTTGEVYVARDAAGVEVALKLIRREADQADPRTRQRFEREGQVLLRFKHENVIRLLDRGHDEGIGRDWMALELVSGRDLATILGRSPSLPDAVALHVIESCARALVAAHEVGVVHRDVKAANVLVTSAGEVKLADFGLAFTLGQTRVTTRDEIPGTLPYMAPEVLLCSDWTPASDAYALGVLAHRVLAGALPFFHREPTRIVEMHLRSAPPDLLKHGVPQELARVIAALLDKAPERRLSVQGALDRIRAAGLSPDPVQAREGAKALVGT